jgi:hypothetical protein
LAQQSFQMGEKVGGPQGPSVCVTRFAQGKVFLVGQEDLRPLITPLGDMMRQSRDDNPRKSCHAASIAADGRVVKVIE